MQRPPIEYEAGNGPQLECGRLVIYRYVSDITPDDHVIDVGCGTGETSFYLQQKYNCHLTAVDISEAMDRDLTDNLGYRSHFSIVTSFFALNWVRDIDTAFDNINWLLKPGGRTFFLIPIYPKPQKIRSVMTMKIMQNPRWKNWVNLTELEAMSVPWPLAGIDTSKGVPWLTERNGFKNILSRHGFDVLHYEIMSHGFQLTKGHIKGSYPVLDLVPEVERDDLLNDMMNIFREGGMSGGYTECIKEEIIFVISIAVKRSDKE